MFPTVKNKVRFLILMLVFVLSVKLKSDGGWRMVVSPEMNRLGDLEPR